MSLLHRFLATGSPAPQTYVDDVFVSYTRTGTGASTTVTTGINLSSLGGLVWTKGRSGATDHKFTDTVRGVQKALVSNSTAAETTDTNGLTAFGTTGHTIGSDSTYNTNGATYVDWVFAKAPKFFDVVTYTGNATNRTISHNLGSVPGMIIVKRTDTTADWQVYSNSIANTEYLVLNSTAAKATGTTRWNSTTPTASVFSLGTDTTVNASGGTYVAYLFAHDTSATGLIQCGSWTQTGSGATVTLGWEPQFVLFKDSTAVTNWRIVDMARGMTASNTDQVLVPNSSAAETAEAGITPTATGFNVSTYFGTSGTFIYLAIRRPNKPPTLGTQVYNAQRTASTTLPQLVNVGFPADLGIRQDPNGATPIWWDRLRGNIMLQSANTNAETANQGFDNSMLGWSDASSGAGATRQYWGFKRAPGVFDVVCYTGTGASHAEYHNLGVVPELVIVKSRVGDGITWPATGWSTYCANLGISGSGYLVLNTQGSAAGSPGVGVFWSAFSATTFSVGTSSETNGGSGNKFVAYLFATAAGISKVGSYTGNGSSQTINAGFTTGARFVLIKRTDDFGDWYVWNSATGIVAGNDPHLSLNTTAAEVTTDDSVDTDTSGFIVNQLAATNINVTSATYIYLSFA